MRAPHSADLETGFLDRVVRARRDAVRWPVVFRRNGLVLDGELPQRKGRAADFLRPLNPGARPIPRPDRDPVVRGGKERLPGGEIAAASQSLVTAFFLHSENATHDAR